MNERIAPQPAPIATDSKPVWLLVIEDAKKLRKSDLLIADMLARHEQGIVKYGVPLRADNGRDHLIDAYQEALDLCVYLRAEMCNCNHADALYYSAIVLVADIRSELFRRDGK